MARLWRTMLLLLVGLFYVIWIYNKRKPFVTNRVFQIICVAPKLQANCKNKRNCVTIHFTNDHFSWSFMLHASVQCGLQLFATIDRYLSHLISFVWLQHKFHLATFSLCADFGYCWFDQKNSTLFCSRTSNIFQIFRFLQINEKKETLWNNGICVPTNNLISF